MLTGIRTGLSIEQYLATLIQPVRSADADSDGLDAADIKAFRVRQQASARASALSRVFTYDLEGDGVATRVEVASGQLDRPDSLFDRYDLNNDGRITVAEVTSTENESSVDQGGVGLERLLALDPNKDGRLTAA